MVLKKFKIQNVQNVYDVGRQKGHQECGSEEIEKFKNVMTYGS